MSSNQNALYSSLLERGRELHRLLLNARDWSKIDHHQTCKNVTLYKRTGSHSGTQLPALKAVGLAEGYSENLGAVLQNMKGRDFWDMLFDQHELVARIDPETYIVRYGMRPVRSSNPRDFVVLTHSSTARSTHLHVAVSVPSNQYPSKPSHVRGHIDLLTWLIEPDEEQHLSTSSTSGSGNSLQAHSLSLLSSAPRLRVSCTLLLDPRHALHLASYLTWLTSELPKSVALVCEYLSRRGFPPHISYWGSRVNIDNEVWNEADEFEVTWSLSRPSLHDSVNNLNNQTDRNNVNPPRDANSDTSDDDSGVGWEDGSRDIEVRLDATRWTGLEITLKSSSINRLLDSELVDVRQDHEGGIVIRAEWWSTGNNRASSKIDQRCILRCRRAISTLGTVMINGDLQELLPETISVSSAIGSRDNELAVESWEQELKEAMELSMDGQFLSYPAQWQRGMDMDSLLSSSTTASRRGKVGRPRAMSANNIIMPSTSSSIKWFSRFRRSNKTGIDVGDTKHDLSASLGFSSPVTQDILGDLPARGRITLSSSFKPRRFSLSSVLWRPSNTSQNGNASTVAICTSIDESHLPTREETTRPLGQEITTQEDEMDDAAEVPESMLWAIPRETSRFYTMIEVIIMASAALVVGALLRIFYRVFGSSNIYFFDISQPKVPVVNHPAGDEVVAAAALAHVANGLDGGILMGGMIPAG